MNRDQPAGHPFYRLLFDERRRRGGCLTTFLVRRQGDAFSAVPMLDIRVAVAMLPPANEAAA